MGSKVNHIGVGLLQCQLAPVEVDPPSVPLPAMLPWVPVLLLESHSVGKDWYCGPAELELKSLLFVAPLWDPISVSYEDWGEVTPESLDWASASDVINRPAVRIANAVDVLILVIPIAPFQ